MNANGSGKFIVAESSDEFTDYGGPAWSPDGKRIAHAVYGDQAQSGIYTVPVTGDEATPQLVVSDGSQASWSPDGQKIAYVFAGRGGYGSLHVIDVRTLRERELSGQRTATPAWSPGGKRIAFSVRATDGSYDVYAVDPDGSHLVRLTRPVRSSGPPSTASDFSDVTNSGPAWSPDGGRLAFVSGRRTPSNRSTATVAVIGVDGKGRRRLTAGGRPMWSPDGGRIAFVESDDAGADIDVIDLDGGNRRRLVRTLRSYPQVDWSPDGTRIAYDESENNQALIYVLNVETGARSLVVSDGYAPDWSADGARIMFQSYDSKENRYYLEVVKSDGTDRHRILAGSEPWEGLRWSPDDRRIAYVSVRGGIWIMNADGSDARRLLDGYGYVPSWSPDGSSIAFEQRLEVMTVPSNGGTPRRVTYGGCTIVGTDGGDLLAGTPNDDVICAFDGKDTITAGAGEDRILGGNGGDRIFGGPGRDRIFGEDGPDAVDGGPGSDSIRTGKGPDVIVADDGEPDAIDGEEGRDCAIADARDHLVAIERRGCPRVR
jgi:Tol biopolymer transport system component